jgi:hypothetical protein
MKISTPLSAATVGGLLIACLAMTGCTAQSDPSPTAPFEPTSSAIPTTPSASAEFAAQDIAVAKTYPDRVPAGTFTGSSDAAVTVLPSTSPGQTMIVMLLNCTGTGTYSITIDQQHPNTVGATCGDAGLAVLAIPLDNPAGTQTLNVAIPNGSQYWLSTYYAKK